MEDEQNEGHEEQVQEQDKKEKVKRGQHEVRGPAEPQRRTASWQPAADNPTTLKEPAETTPVSVSTSMKFRNVNPHQEEELTVETARRTHAHASTHTQGSVLPLYRLHAHPLAKLLQPQSRLIQAPAEVPGTKDPYGSGEAAAAQQKTENFRFPRLSK
ncbi:unnamed protein product [Ectocarpus sp. 12 AP-2014]